MNRLIFEKHSLNEAYWLPKLGESSGKLREKIPSKLLRKKEAKLPSVSELDVVRHYTNLSQKNFCVDTDFYPLGSCTMKYNPKVLDSIASATSFTQIHPYQAPEEVQGALQILFQTQRFLSEITGMDEFTLQPAAGAHGEFCGLLIAGAWHRSRKQQRKKVLVPDSSHGTNPASAALSGFEVVQVATNKKGLVDLTDLKNKLDDQVACLMMTNPNTLGLFEEDILEISKLVHNSGGLLYYDGANMNALLGICRPGDMGFDIVHLNLHKTFGVPHGAGGPGSGPVGVKKELIPFLPSPRIIQQNKMYNFDKSNPASVGKLRSFYGNFGAIIRAYAYIVALGSEGLKGVSENAVINANYIKKCLKDDFVIPYESYCMHEFVLSASAQKAKGVKALDIAKRLLDYGIHAPTIYFPMIVEEAMMIEPTETESIETLDNFIHVLKQINSEINSSPDKVLQAPHTTPVGRIDEVQAARQPNLRFQF